jgi:hypothetical protein
MGISQSIYLGNAKTYINENNSLVFKNLLLQKGVSSSGYNYSLKSQTRLLQLTQAI